MLNLTYVNLEKIEFCKLKEGDGDLGERRKTNLMRSITGLLIIKRPEYHRGYTLTTSLYAYDTPERT